MIRKITVIPALAISGLMIVGLSAYLVNQPPKPEIKKAVILAGQDLPASPEALGVGTTKETSDELKGGSKVFKDQIKASKGLGFVTSAPSTIKTTNKGDNLLVLVNKSIRLPSSYFPKDLVSVDKSITASFGGMQLRGEAAENLIKLFTDAKKKGYKLHLNSAYRSYQTQVATYNYWVSQVGAAEADRFSARPGHSQHQLGTTVDITSDTVDHKLISSFGDTLEGKWLASSGYKYGFVLAYPADYENITGYTYEPWHFRYISIANAKKWKASGMILELYLKKLGVW